MYNSESLNKLETVRVLLSSPLATFLCVHSLQASSSFFFSFFSPSNVSFSEINFAVSTGNLLLFKFKYIVSAASLQLKSKKCFFFLNTSNTIQTSWLAEEIAPTREKRQRAVCKNWAESEPQPQTERRESVNLSFLKVLIPKLH